MILLVSGYILMSARGPPLQLTRVVADFGSVSLEVVTTHTVISLGSVLY